MILKSFGCSFIFGTDLADSSCAKEVIVPSHCTWPAIIAKKKQYHYSCFARPGAGNLQIAEQVLSQASSSDNSLFVINWSWIDRFDHWGPKNFWTNGNQWQTIHPTDKTETSKIYYQNLHTEYRDKLTTLMSIKLVIDTLQQKDIKFIMTHMDDLIFDTQWHTTPVVLDLQDYIKPYIIMFDNKNFLNWSRSKGFPESVAWHPLEKAHRAAADYIITKCPQISFQ